jgi:hypothetical protein
MVLSFFKHEEVIAKLALEVKFDDFFIGLIRRKSIIPWGRRRFATDRANEKSADLAPNWSFATTSEVRTILITLYLFHVDCNNYNKNNLIYRLFI